MRNKRLGLALKRGTCLVSAFAMAATMMVPVAFGDDSEAVVYNAPTSPIAVDGNYVTATAKAFAQGTPDLLGVTNTTFNGSSSAGAAGSTAAAQINNMYGMYGSDANKAPNPYIYNYFYNLYAAENGLPDSDQATLWTRNGGPTGADTTIDSTYGTSLALARRPDILYGQGGTATTGSDGTTVYNDAQGLTALRNWGGYAQLILEIRTWTNNEGKVGTYNNDGNKYVYSEFYQAGDENYNPIGLSASTASTPFSFLSGCVWPMAEAAQTVISESNGSKYLRYSTPSEQATNIEKYAKAPSWYVLEQLQKEGKEKKSGIIVSGCDKDAGTVNLVNMDLKSEANSNNLGSVIANVAQETLTDASTSIKTESVEVTSGRSTSIVQQTTISELAKAKVDVVICTSNVGDTLEAMYADAKATAPSTIWSADSVKLLFNTWDGPRSPECLMSAGLVQGFLYPEYLNEVDLMTWYMTTVVGLTNEGVNQFYGISFGTVPTSEGLQWSTDGFNATKINKQLNEGTRWYLANKDAVDASNPNIVATSQFVSNWTSTSATAADLEAAQEELAQAKETISGLQDELAEVKASAAATSDELTSAKKTITDLQGTVSAAEKTIANNKTASDAEISTLKGQISDMNDTIANLQAELTLSQVGNVTKTYTVAKAAKKAQSFTIAAGVSEVIYSKVSGSAKLSVSQAGKVVLKKGTKKGTYKISVDAMASSQKSKTITVTVKVK